MMMTRSISTSALQRSATSTSASSSSRRSGPGSGSRRPLWSEQDPRLWWDGATVSIRRALDNAGLSGADVAAVGLTGQMHGLVLLDERDEVLRPAILWNDQRTAAECD